MEGKRTQKTWEYYDRMKRKCMYDKMWVCLCVSARAYFGACMSERKREREIKGVRMETKDTVKQLGIKKKSESQFWTIQKQLWCVSRWKKSFHCELITVIPKDNSLITSPLWKVKIYFHQEKSRFMSYLELMFIFKLPLAGMWTGNASTVTYILFLPGTKSYF